MYSSTVIIYIFVFKFDASYSKQQYTEGMGAVHHYTSWYTHIIRIDFVPGVKMQGVGVNSDHPVIEDNDYTFMDFSHQVRLANLTPM